MNEELTIVNFEGQNDSIKHIHLTLCAVCVR